jgi:N-acetylglucosamine kinase-like BadF-type ATPase
VSERPEVPAVLAIDGGNSKTDVALVAADGRLLAQARGGRSNPQVIGMHEAFAVLRELVESVARAAGVPGDAPVVASHASACLAGADLPDEEQQLTDLVQAQGWTASSLVVNDTFAVLRAGLDDAADPSGAAGQPGDLQHGDSQHGGSQHWGIGVTCGAGINCVGVAPDGETTRFLSLGDISGDWGGGRDLARDALWWAIRAEDGRGPQTELRAAVAAHFGLPTVRDVVLGVYHEKISGGDLHGLVPVLLSVAGRGDQVARDLVIRLANEICDMIMVAATRLRLTGTGVPVVLGGGLMTARDPLLSASITRRLAADLPHAAPRIVDVPPVAGAALLGLDHVGAPPAAARALRSAYQDPAPTPPA